MREKHTLGRDIYGKEIIQNGNYIDKRKEENIYRERIFIEKRDIE